LRGGIASRIADATPHGAHDAEMQHRASWARWACESRKSFLMHRLRRIAQPRGGLGI